MDVPRLYGYRDCVGIDFADGGKANFSCSRTSASLGYSRYGCID
jgi:hypothetical protein